MATLWHTEDISALREELAAAGHVPPSRDARLPRGAYLCVNGASQKNAAVNTNEPTTTTAAEAAMRPPVPTLDARRLDDSRRSSATVSAPVPVRNTETATMTSNSTKGLITPKVRGAP